MLNTVVALIIPVYNTEIVKLRSCIKSILRQTFRDFVLILVDDGSVNSCGDVCDSFAANDKRIRVIHQNNMGSVRARQNGVLSEEAQGAKYICFCDSDDTMPCDALQLLVDNAEREKADCVCGNTRRTYRGIPLPQKFTPPCFAEKLKTVYSNRDIINKLYISCFGISNYPVALYSKLYRKELITQVSNYPPIVKFMGEDLSVTLRLLPKTEKLVIIPDEIYNYNIGGGTSRFMPFMLEDFLSLYKFKKEMMILHPMPQNAEYFISVEMKNIIMTWLEMCCVQGKYDSTAINDEILRVCNIAEVREAMEQKDFAEKETGGIRKAILDNNVDYIRTQVAEKVSVGKYRRIIKSILK